MKIGINLLPFRKNLTGTGVYAYSILHELSKQDTKNSYILFANYENSHIFNIKSKNFKTVVFPFYAKNIMMRIFWEQFIFPFYLKKYHVNLLFSPSVVLPIFSRCKNVVCIHDLIPFHINKKYTRLRSFYIRKMTKISAKKADRVLTVSHNSKKELQTYCKIPSEKIAITYSGINNALMKLNKKKWKQFKNDKSIPDHYILYVGTLEPGKNINTLIAAFNMLKKNYSISQKLILAGGKGWLFHSIFENIKKLSIEDHVIFSGYIPNEILGLLYKNADVFVLPSLYEGFGIPVIEAMYFGTPVVVSNISSLPEVVGDAGKLINPHNTTNLAEAIYEVLSNPSLRKIMIERGYNQLTKFSWENSARIVLNEFSKLK